jgi:hypothetical protein
MGELGKKAGAYFCSLPSTGAAKDSKTRFHFESSVSDGPIRPLMREPSREMVCSSGDDGSAAAGTVTLGPEASVMAGEREKA